LFNNNFQVIEFFGHECYKALKGNFRVKAKTMLNLMKKATKTVEA
jgi:hypothetical protein